MCAPPNQEITEAIASQLAAEERGHAVDDAVEMLAAVDHAGLVIAPREPTSEMLAAGAKASGMSVTLVHKMWRVMLAAAD